MGVRHYLTFVFTAILVTIGLIRLNQFLSTRDEGALSNFNEQVEREGFAKQVLVAGDGKTFPKKGDKIKVHYVGTLVDGTEFDSSRKTGTPFVTRIGVGSVIRGWDEGVPLMSLGEKARLTISYKYAYGERGYPNVIPPKATVIFEIELLAINQIN